VLGAFLYAQAGLKRSFAANEFWQCHLTARFAPTFHPVALQNGIFLNIQWRSLR
jgi:hypothetical protein